MNHKALLLWIFLQCAAALFSSALGENAALKGEDSGLDELPTESKGADGNVKYNMRKSLDLEQEGCYLQAGKRECLEECGFNATAKTIFIIHGWTDEQQLPLESVHLIGYSLGAHVAGYAGTFVRGTIGRITGLDPAGPMFEGVPEQKRLSPDDADFVDVLHTYTREALGVSIGIQQPIGDIDIYPNGGDVQPGCALGDVLAVAGNFMEVMKCEHERAVHLFVDSLMNKDHMSFAFQCTGPDRFKKGICLSCRKNRCNNIGYNTRKMRKRRNTKMYLKTRADTPFGGYHYQMKMHVFNRKRADDADPTFYVKLYGAHNDTSDLFVDVHDNAIGLNLTNTFLVFTEADIGDLLKIKLSWEGDSESWNSVWKNLKKTFWGWNTKPPKPVLQVRRIRVKAGETQKKFTFCAQDSSKTEISPGDSVTFTKCRDGWEVKPRKRLAM
uniref:endothelial lipase isoform X3 n=1 Tax=Semicossyphus pulcher TaxID=241346 RepID=UPI0037E704C8